VGSAYLAIQRWLRTGRLTTTAETTIRMERRMLHLVKYLCVFARVNS
jgi:hypothetical protein